MVAPILVLETWMMTERLKFTGHEGRNRMVAIDEVYGDVPIEVHLFPRGKRARNITPDVLKRLRKDMTSESFVREDDSVIGGDFVNGPLFEDDKKNYLAQYHLPKSNMTLAFLTTWTLRQASLYLKAQRVTTL